MYQQAFIFGAAFLGSAVEATEALTIVLAVGLTRGWREPLLGTLLAIVLLGLLVLVFGQLIVTTIPEWALKLLVGTLLLLFGLRWLHKAVLRSAGVVAMHDEERAYQDAVSRLGETVGGRDWVGFVLALKGVFLEGLEVVFIVIAVGGPGHAWTAAIAGGLVAAVVVAVAGVAVRAPLARVPENTLKFAVGILLTSLGTFWAAEGMGASWPGDFLSIFALAGIFLVASQLAVTVIRRPALA